MYFCDKILCEILKTLLNLKINAIFCSIKLKCSLEAPDVCALKPRKISLFLKEKETGRIPRRVKNQISHNQFFVVILIEFVEGFRSRTFDLTILARTCCSFCRQPVCVAPSGAFAKSGTFAVIHIIQLQGFHIAVAIESNRLMSAPATNNSAKCFALDKKAKQN
mmetsp:Transcript_2555/g.4802  ORF Transcript_2555/g.4802 Transcript_2555/m.4802 type:complete len:164 (-) Transcript_2555:3142-3633(-)